MPFLHVFDAEYLLQCFVSRVVGLAILAKFVVVLHQQAFSLEVVAEIPCLCIVSTFATEKNHAIETRFKGASFVVSPHSDYLYCFDIP